MRTKTAQQIGYLGEMLVKRKIESLGVDVLWTAQLDVGYDLLVGNTLKVEVKTARKNKRGQFQFCLTKLDHADIQKADCVILQCMVCLNCVVSYTIPVSALGARHQITLSGNINSYNGPFAQYRN